ncbi:MAG: putative amidophosphoribosyltransferase, partial [Porphyrobacter sp. HL-46]
IAINRAKADKIAGRDIVLVDDVFTSGATIRACIAALSKAGARSMAVACFARVDEAGAIRGGQAGKAQRDPRPKNETPEAL